MSHVRLHRVTAVNWQDCANLKVKDEQAGFLPDNHTSITEALFYPQTIPMAIYNDREQMVGFVMYGLEISQCRWKIFRLMIDEKFQGRGYARATMKQVIQHLIDRPDCDAIYLTCHNHNHAARKLYQNFGFVEQDQAGGKVLARLDLNGYTGISEADSLTDLPLLISSR